MSKAWIEQVAGYDAELLIALPIREKEDAVPVDRSAGRQPKLPALKERIGIRGVPRQRRISG
jgi:hypothetical protein